jgi:hypothetical protein
MGAAKSLSATFSPASTSYLLSQSFEDTGAPSGWSVPVPAPNWDYATTALEGTQSLAFTGYVDTAATTSPAFAPQSSASAFFLFRGPYSVGSSYIPYALRSGATTVAHLSFRNTGRFRFYHGSVYGEVVSISANTTYCIWMDYTAGTGSNGTLYSYVSTPSGGVCTKPASASATVTTGTSTASVDTVRVGKDAAEDLLIIFDKILVDDTTIGNVTGVN